MIVNINQVKKISNKLKNRKKIIVLVGGCFDILHIGHIKFLQKAKEKGDFLFVLLESDESVKKLKGSKRPINTQKDRAEILSSLKMVDYVIILPKLLKDGEYDKLIKSLRPNVLAVTVGDKNIKHKVRQAKITGAKVIPVLKRIKNKSTRNILKNHK